MLVRSVILSIMLFLLSSFTPFVAYASGESGVVSTDSGNTVTVSATNSSSSNSTTSSGPTTAGQSPCTWQKAPAVLLQEAGLTAMNSDGYWELVTCPNASQLPSPGQNVVWSAITLMPIAFVWVNAVTPTLSVSASLIQQAEDSIQLPNPTLTITPNPGVVNLSESLSINNEILHNYVASASAGGITVVATAQPNSIAWQMGNGDTVDCSVDYQTSCNYTYLTSSVNEPYIWNSEPSFKVTATIQWSVSWYSTGIVDSGNLQPLYTQGFIYLPVMQIESVLNTP